jgi:nucleotide-binding universal stress UspA family protein
MHILLPVDGSPPSKETVRWVCDMMNPATTQFSLLTVIPDVLAELPVDTVQIEDALALLKVYRETLEKAGYEVLEADYMIGDPAPCICAYAEDKAVDQIFVGSHGRTGLGRVVFGSVSSAVFKQAKKPVFVHRNVDATALSAS